jgi:hypothetical protein
MKHLKTDFRKFILEKLHSEKKRKHNEDEIEEVQPDDDIEDEEPIEDGESLEYEEPEDDDEEVGDNVLSELLNEWKKIKKTHDRYKFHRRKK